MDALFLAAALLLVLMGVLAKVLGVFGRRRASPRKPIEDISQPLSTTSLEGYTEPPLSEREVTLKFCPDCGELVLLASHACNYCGSRFPFAPKPVETPDKNPLMLPSKRRERKKPSL